MVNKPIWHDREFVVMILAGPILRADYHDDPYEEFFFQLKGNMVLRTIEDGKHREIPVNEGGVFLMPPHLPHAPHRPEPGSIGLVVERSRPAGVLDGWEWYCPDCATRGIAANFTSTTWRPIGRAGSPPITTTSPTAPARTAVPPTRKTSVSRPLSGLRSHAERFEPSADPLAVHAEVALPVYRAAVYGEGGFCI